MGLTDSSAWTFGIVESLQELLHSSNEVSAVLVDIPIGLRSQGPEERKCDIRAREVLGPRRSSVFPTPCRPAVHASGPDEASDLNQELTGRRLSAQAANIIGKIREVDWLMQGNGEARKVVREVHPEVCFWALNGKSPLHASKKEAKGQLQRLDILSSHHLAAGDIVASALLTYSRSQVARDDVLDALAAAVTAGHPDKWKTLPPNPETDDVGLPMQMIYWVPKTTSPMECEI